MTPAARHALTLAVIAVVAAATFIVTFGLTILATYERMHP